jgi:hypothetical protein
MTVEDFDAAIAKMDWQLFRFAFDCDPDFRDDVPQSAYLDLISGKVIWVFENDSDACSIGISNNKATREQIEASPGNYLPIPGRTYWEHHCILRDFLNSNWTDDAEARNIVRAAYFGSIGAWMRGVDKSGAEAFRDFRDQRLEELAENFLLQYRLKVKEQPSQSDGLPQWQQHVHVHVRGAGHRQQRGGHPVL